MNEQAIRPNNNFDNFKALIDGIVAEISDVGRADVALAAE